MATRLKPDYGEAYQMKGTVLFQEQKFRLAAYSFKLALESAKYQTEESNWYTLQKRGAALRRLHEWTQAAEVWREMIRLRQDQSL